MSISAVPFVRLTAVAGTAIIVADVVLGVVGSQSRRATSVPTQTLVIADLPVG